MTYRKIIWLPIIIIYFTSGCSTLKESVGLGASIGAISGAVVGNQSSNQDQAQFNGAIAGAVLGSLIGYAAHSSNEKKKLKDAFSPQIKMNEPPAPKLTRPVVRRIWIDEQIKDNGATFETGHWKYILEKESVWSR